MAMEVLMKGALTYSRTGRQAFLNQLKSLQSPVAVMISCVDSRVFPSQFLSAEPGQLYIVRNAGNFVPQVNSSDKECNVLGTLELACVRNKVNDIVICGHSDCKAMHLLNSMGPSIMNDKLQTSQMTPLQQWVAKNGMEGLRKQERKPNVLEFPIKDMSTLKTPLRLKLTALKDLSDVDRLSQINVVQQMSHVYSHPLLTERFKSGTLHVHGIWFHVHEAQLHMYSRPRQRFVSITETTFPELVAELNCDSQHS
ncbi:Carbonic anhydrase [Paragonimus heterotremus]|uniref:Carbonic anhydrase n=1 Tax=Paragonimus heterotremus TaxID=100268 RepID=A0A8J4T6P3_9TREM|nr:Carbonic anhydrase [Paragonimus heterotremus]